MTWVSQEQREAFYKSPEWRELREQAFRYHGRACRICGTRQHLEVNHVDYRRFGGKERMIDLMPLCREHHQSVTDYVFKEHKGEADMYGDSWMWHLTFWWFFETKRKITNR